MKFVMKHTSTNTVLVFIVVFRWGCYRNNGRDSNKLHLPSLTGTQVRVLVVELRENNFSELCIIAQQIVFLTSKTLLSQIHSLQIWNFTVFYSVLVSCPQLLSEQLISQLRLLIVHLVLIMLPWWQVVLLIWWSLWLPSQLKFQRER